MQYGKSCSFLICIHFKCFADFLAFFSGFRFDIFSEPCYIYAGLDWSSAMVCGNMEVESSKSYIDNLYDNHEDKVGSAVVTLKNAVIGSQRQKDTIIEQGVLARLIHLLVDPEISTRIKTDVVYILGSITNGSEANLKSLNDADVVAILLNGLVSQDDSLAQVFKVATL